MHSATGRLAYLVSEYPKASHSFIRREILELERTVGPVLRVAIRSGSASIRDPQDIEEWKKTIYALDRSPVSLAAATAEMAASRPIRYREAVEMSVNMWRASNRGAVRHSAYLAEAAFIARVLERHHIEHLHVHFGLNSASVARIVHCLTGIPYSLSIHGPGEFDEPEVISLTKKIHDATFVRAVSHFGAGQLRRWTEKEDEWDKIHVVHCTVDDHFFEEPTPIEPESKTIVCVGRLTAPKAQLLLLDALNVVVNDGVDIDLVLAGDGEMRPQVEARIDKHDLANYVRITGWIEESEVKRILRSARALILPSLAEGLPVVIMEALALGRPVITTMIAGIPELMTNECGWLIPSGSVEHIANAIREVMATPADRLDAMGRIGRERAMAGHRTSTEIAKLRELFEQYRRPPPAQIPGPDRSRRTRPHLPASTGGKK